MTHQRSIFLVKGSLLVHFLFLVIMSACQQPLCSPGSKMDSTRNEQPMSLPGAAYDFSFDGTGTAIYAGGYCRGNSSLCVTSSALDYDALYYKINITTGQVLWNKQIGSFTTRDYVNGVVIDPSDGHPIYTVIFNGGITLDGTLITSRGGTDVLVFKVNQFSGLSMYNFYHKIYIFFSSELWYQQFGGAVDDTNGIARFDPSGNLYFAMSFNGNVNFGSFSLTATGALSDIALMQLDPKTGVVLAAQRIGGPDIEDVSAFKIDSRGYLYLNILFSATLQIGNNTYLGRGGYDMAVTCFAPNFTLSWVKLFGGSGNEQSSSDLFIDENFAYSAISFSGLVTVFMADDSMTLKNASHAFVFKMQRTTGQLVAKIPVFEGFLVGIFKLSGSSKSGDIYANGYFAINAISGDMVLEGK